MLIFIMFQHAVYPVDMSEATVCFTLKAPCNSVNINRILTEIGTDISLWTTKPKFKLNRNMHL